MVSNSSPDDAANDTLDAALADTEVAVSPAAEPAHARRLATVPPSGSRVGRYTLVGELGRGGMGVVVAAHDPELDRRVAIKLISAGAGAHREQLQARLLREARAMAKIRHPNVVSVYEVGEHEGQVYLAMEQVDGGTLRDELRERRGESWKLIVERFIEAGRGLAAAHAAGLIHRDFKPENVFVDRDGRVLVGDFGLAGAHVEVGESGSEPSSLDDRLTRADMVLGTPGYMAPEQHEGAAVDGRADQFAFCVALYEALYGKRPFAGETTPEYVEAVLAGDVAEPPPGRKMPAWLRAAMLRGLSRDPGDRFSSMDELLLALGADPARDSLVRHRVRLAVVAAGGAFWIAATALVWALDVELTYAHLHARNVALLLLAALLTVIGRRRFARAGDARKVLEFGLFAAATLAVFAAGSHLMALPLDTLLALHLLMAGALVTILAVTLDARLAAAGLIYIGGFLAASMAPSLYVTAALAGHAAITITLLIVIAGPGQGVRRSPPSVA